MPAAKIEGRIFLALWRGALVARIGADDVDLWVRAGDGGRFDPADNGKPFADWLAQRVDGRRADGTRVHRRRRPLAASASWEVPRTATRFGQFP
jgi:hypothetical protein